MYVKLNKYKYLVELDYQHGGSRLFCIELNPNIVGSIGNCPAGCKFLSNFLTCYLLKSPGDSLSRVYLCELINSKKRYQVKALYPWSEIESLILVSYLKTNVKSREIQ